jgi:hypothetical protein
MTLWSSSSSTTANTVTSNSGPSRFSLPRGRHDDHRDHPTSSQPRAGSSDSGASRRPISSSTTASWSQNSARRVRRRRRNSRADHSADTQDLLLQLVAALASILPPSAALLNVFRRQVSAVNRALTTEEIDVLGPISATKPCPTSHRKRDGQYYVDFWKPSSRPSESFNYSYRLLATIESSKFSLHGPR